MEHYSKRCIKKTFEAITKRKKLDFEQCNRNFGKIVKALYPHDVRKKRNKFRKGDDIWTIRCNQRKWNWCVDSVSLSRTVEDKGTFQSETELHMYQIVPTNCLYKVQWVLIMKLYLKRRRYKIQSLLERQTSPNIWLWMNLIYCFWKYFNHCKIKMIVFLLLTLYQEW